MADENGEQVLRVPASIRSAWGVHERPARGPKPGLTLARVVAAAVTVADAEGLDAVSMSRVAAELGSSPMALYRYVGSKDELLALMFDTEMGRPPAPADGDEPGWRAGLVRWTRGILDLYLQAPWSLRIPIPAPPITPNQIRWLEAGLRVLAGSGLSEREKLSTVLLLSGLARYHATVATDVAEAVRTSGGADPTAGYGAALMQLADPAEFPAVYAAVLSGSLDDEEDFTGDELRFSLDRILDGLQLLMDRRTRPDQASVAGSGHGP